jgi:hypothetical protein
MEILQIANGELWKHRDRTGRKGKPGERCGGLKAETPHRYGAKLHGNHWENHKILDGDVT